MKRLIKRPLKAIWRWTAPARRPFVRKAEAFLARAYAQAPIPAPHVHLTCNCRVTEETSLLMDYMVRELVRLQTQVERLQEAVDDLSPARRRSSGSRRPSTT
jgi:hypothetical protein